MAYQTSLSGVVEERDANGNIIRYIPEPFTYSITFNALTGAWAQASGQIQIQADAAFVIKEQNFSFREIGDPTYVAGQGLIPAIDVLLTDAGSARKLMNQPINITQLFGDGKLPFVLPTEKYLSPSSAFQVQIMSAENFGADAFELQLTFIGEKRYYLN